MRMCRLQEWACLAQVQVQSSVSSWRSSLPHQQTRSWHAWWTAWWQTDGQCFWWLSI